MASVGGVTSSNMTSSLFNSANIISGLASGLDTEGMIESLVQSYQTKINQLNQKATKIEWKQDAYRSIIQKMVGFSNKYTSYTSSTNLTSPSFFNNAVKVITKGEYKDSVTASGKTSSDIELNAVHQLATAAQFRTKSNMSTGTTGIIAGESMDLFKADAIELSNLSGGLTLTYGSKTISLSFNESNDVEAMNDIRANLAKERNVDESSVSDTDVLAGLINQKLADEKIVFNSGSSETADQRVKAVVAGNGMIRFEEQGTARNGVYISNASGNIAEKLGLSEEDLENASETKPVTLQMSDATGGLTRKMSGIDYMVEKSADGPVTMNMSLDGVTKQIKLPQVTSFEINGTKTYILDGSSVTKNNFAEKYMDSLKSSVKDAFGDKVTVENKGTNGGLKLEFKVKNEGSDLVINTDVGNALGIGKTATSYLSTGKTLGDLLGDKLGKGMTQAFERDNEGNYKLDADGNRIPATDSKGNPMYDFVINGVTVGSFSKNSTLSEVLTAINSSDEAGVKAAYSQTTQSFTFTSKETGADSKITMGTGLATTMFGNGMDVDALGSKGIKDVLGQDVKIQNQALTLKVGDKEYTHIFTGTNPTMQQTLSAINKKLSADGYTASYGEEGSLVVTKKNSNERVAVEAAAGSTLAQRFLTGLKDYANANPSDEGYTAGQDAMFTATINGETKNMVRSSNSVNIDGLTVNMNETFNTKGTKGTDGSYGYEVEDDKKTVTFQNKTDSDKIVDAIKTMAEEYNTMMSEIKSAYNTMPYQTSSGSFANYEPLTDDERSGMSESAIERYEAKAKQGILFGDRNLSTLYTKMSQVFSFSNTRDTDALKDMGISLSYNINDGAQALTIDEDKLRAYLDSDPDRVSELFTKTDGIMDRMKNNLDNYSKTTGEPKGILIEQAGSPLSSLSLLSNQWQKEIDNISTQVEKWQDKLEAQVEKYTSQFSRLEVLINQMNSQSSTLAGMMGG